MKHDKKSSRPCPMCMIPLPRANQKSYLEKCNDCHKMMCATCSFAGLCMDCFNKESKELIKAEYYIEKYGKVGA